MDHQAAGRDSKQETSHRKRFTKQAPHKSCVMPEEKHWDILKTMTRGLGKNSAVMNLMHVCVFLKAEKDLQLDL